MTPRQVNTFTSGLMVIALLSLIVLTLCGCDVNTKVRPFFWPKEKPPEEVQPATPQPAPKPQPPPDDWAPPWFHRPKTGGER